MVIQRDDRVNGTGRPREPHDRVNGTGCPRTPRESPRREGEQEPDDDREEEEGTVAPPGTLSASRARPGALGPDDDEDDDPEDEDQDGDDAEEQEDDPGADEEDDQDEGDEDDEAPSGPDAPHADVVSPLQSQAGVRRRGIYLPDWALAVTAKDDEQKKLGYVRVSGVGRDVSVNGRPMTEAPTLPTDTSQSRD